MFRTLGGHQKQLLLFSSVHLLLHQRREMVSILVIGTILSLFASLALRGYMRKCSKLPPGNIGWPLIGETLSLIEPHPTTTRGPFLENCIAKFGKIFSSNLAGKRRIVSTDPELNRLILKNDGNMFEIDWPHNLKKLMSKFAIMLLTGDEHKHMRSVVHNFLSIKRLRSVCLRDAQQLASELLCSWEDSEVISAQEQANKFAFNFSVKQMLGMDVDDPWIEKLQREYKTFSRGISSIPLFVPGTVYWKAFKSRAYILNVLKEKTDELIRKKSDGVETTERDNFLSCVVKDTDYTAEQLSGLLLNLLFAGYHNTSKALTSLIYFLKGCPMAVAQLREENIQILETKLLSGDSALTWDDYMSMNFSHCVINEVLRLSSIAPFSFRKSTADFSYKGFVIPRDSSIIIHTKGMHLDPSLFEDPQQFNPWRWLGSSSLKRIDGFMPFGGGVRLCVGNVLTRLEMIVFLHSFIMKYDWEFVEPDDPLSSPTMDFAKGLKIKVHSLSNKLQKM